MYDLIIIEFLEYKNMSISEIILLEYSPISLKEMENIKLMNRTDTKYILSKEKLNELLSLAVNDYFVQQINGERNISYYTNYLDTSDDDMYITHHNGRYVREKIRIRSYVSSNLNFLEVKNKNNKGCTNKKRIRISSLDSLEKEGGRRFLDENAWYNLDQLSFSLENKFNRITLVNKLKTERLTIDSNIRFHNIKNDKRISLDNVAIVELKRNGRSYSPIRSILQDLNIQPSGFSKYCIGRALTDKSLKQNMFKTKIRRILEINNN